MTPILPIERFEIFASGLDHPECVAFDRDGNAWAGGEAGQVYRIDVKGNVEEVTSLGSFNAGLAFSPDGALFVCNPAKGVIRLDPRGGKHEIFATGASGERLLCANFPLFDKAGNLYVSDSGHWTKRNGRVVRLAPDGRGETIVAPFGYANGLALDEDRRLLFIVESDTNAVFSAKQQDDGTYLTPIEHFSPVGRMPDGITMDPSGHLYVACYASDEIWRLQFTGERQLFAHDPWAIKLSRPTNIAFHDGMIYVANLGRYTITRAKL